MEASEKLIPINVNICDRPYRLKIRPEEEESVRKAAKMINDKVKEMTSTYSVKDKQDYLAMSSLMITVEQLNKEHHHVIEDDAVMRKIGELDKQLSEILNS
jgi:cell division protein ZapA